jgi:CBS domain-containing protein
MTRPRSGGTRLATFRSMSLTVKDLMTVSPLVLIGPDDDLERAGNTMAWTRVRHLPVVENGALVGILSERDFIRARVQDGTARTVRAAMRSPVAFVGPDDPIETALAMMVSHNFGCLPVMSSEGIVGMLTTTDLLRHQLYAAFDREARATSPPVAR